MVAVSSAHHEDFDKLYGSFPRSGYAADEVVFDYIPGPDDPEVLLGGVFDVADE